MYDRLYNSVVQQRRYYFDPQLPRNFEEFKTPYLEYTNSFTHDFTGNHRQRQNTAWFPDSLDKPTPPLIIQSAQIYHKHLGQIPNYCGHIPGKMFRFGKTFGNDSRDAKRWLRGDYSI